MTNHICCIRVAHIRSILPLYPDQYQINPNTEVIFVKQDGEVPPWQEHGVEQVEDVEAGEET